MKKLSHNELTELMDMYADIIRTIQRFRHAHSKTEDALGIKMQKRFDDLVHELYRRENEG